MPDYVFIDLYVKGTQEQLEEFVRKYFADDQLDFNKIMPIPPSIENKEDEDDWKLDYWYTTYNAIDTYYDINDNWLHVEFKTAWGFPLPIYQKLIRDNPSLEFVLAAHIETGDYIVQAHNNDIRVVYRDKFVDKYVK